jgi:adenylosuccinate synthase
MMKADILSGFDKIPVCHSYVHEGEQIPNLPFGIEPDEVTPVFF